MTKAPMPLRVDDLTVFTRALSRQIGETSPSHLKLMNMVARAAGFQNVQHLRSASAATKRLDSKTENIAFDARSVERVLHQFDEFGRLHQWPSKRSVQTLALWALWVTLPAKKAMSEKELNGLLAEEHHFSDPATLRRTMVSCGLLTRQNDGTEYRRIEQKPSVEAKSVIDALSARRHARSSAKIEVQHA
tara:strand:+ start:413 stop:982 length:570 start_codon:yes stop_codon:yes gene_type:complete